MENDFLRRMGTDAKELEDYIKQIKSYEEQLKIIERSAVEEEKLKKKRPDWKLVLWTGIAGMKYYIDTESPEGNKMRRSLRAGVELKLVREPENKYDRWAIAVHTKKGEKIGHITRYKNETIARLMDAGFVFHIYVESRRKANFEVPEGQRAFTEKFDIPCSVWME